MLGKIIVIHVTMAILTGILRQISKTHSGNMQIKQHFSISFETYVSHLHYDNNVITVEFNTQILQLSTVEHIFYSL